MSREKLIQIDSYEFLTANHASIIHVPSNISRISRYSATTEIKYT